MEKRSVDQDSKDGSSASGCAVPEEVVKKTRAVLLSNTKGVLLKSFSKDYCHLAGEPFPWKRLGYSSMISLLQAMPDAVHFEYSGKDGDYKLHGVGDSKSFFMPSWILKTQERIRRQRSLSPLAHSHSSSLVRSAPPKISRSHSVEPGARDLGGVVHQLTYNDRGLVTLYVKWKGCSMQSPRSVQAIITEHFSKIDRPVEVFVQMQDGKSSASSGIAFVRFNQITTAEEVLRQLNDSTHSGLKFRITPAKDRKNSPRKNNSVTNGSMRSPPNYRHRHSSSSSSDGASPSKKMNGYHLSRSRDHHMTDLSRSHDYHMTNTPSSVKNRFRGLINELDPDDNPSDSDDSSLMDYTEWERVLDTVPSAKQLINRSAPSRFSKNYHTNRQNTSSKTSMASCDLSHDHPYGHMTLNSESHGWARLVQTHVSTSVASCDLSHDHTYSHMTSNGEPQGWDLAPPSLSGPNPQNQIGLVQAHVSEVVDPHLIWLQLSSDLEGDMNTISNAIETSSPKPLEKVAVGDYCCIRCSSSPTEHNSEERVNYKRAVVKSIKGSPIKILRQAAVSLIDSGVERKAVPLGDLLELPTAAHPCVFSPLATPCSLHGIESINEGEGWFPLDVQLLWKLLYHKEVFAKEVERADSQQASSEDQTTAVELYFDPQGSVSVVDVLVQEGMRMDYARPLHPLQDSGYSEEREYEMSNEIQMTKKGKTATSSSLNNLSVVMGDGLETSNCKESDESCDSEDTLIQPNFSTSGPSEPLAHLGDSGRAVESHMTVSKLLIGRKAVNDYSCAGYESGEEKGANQTPRSHWQEFLDFCDEVSL